ncbi:hypothetical protein ACP6H1_27460 [Vibrio harveyi]|uniref:hypothetical protein n=1 Tax=Vibrio harveyi TaxID=669 RepID=UPI003CEA442A
MKAFVNQAVIYAIESEIDSLKCKKRKLEDNAKRNNKDIRFNKAWQEVTNQIARLSKALKPLTNQYY